MNSETPCQHQFQQSVNSFPQLSIDLSFCIDLSVVTFHGDNARKSHTPCFPARAEKDPVTQRYSCVYDPGWLDLKLPLNALITICLGVCMTAESGAEDFKIVIGAFILFFVAAVRQTMGSSVVSYLVQARL